MDKWTPKEHTNPIRFMLVKGASIVDVTIAQIDIPARDTERAWLKIEQVAARAPNGNLVIFPELATTGYYEDSINAESKRLEDAVYRLATMAVGHNVNILLSIPVEEQINGETKRFNTAVLVNQQGKVIASYKKRHLFRPMGEHKLFEHGNSLVTTKFGGLTLGLTICYDLRFPIDYRKLRMQQADVLTVVAEWPITRIDHWRTLLQARAIENQAWVIGVNRVGKDDENTFGGHSMIVAPDGEIKVELGDKEDNVEFHISRDAVERARHLFDIVEDELE